ncbi:MAG: hypothetical protein V1816_01515 [Pseudomonadota bacterium]
MERALLLIIGLALILFSLRSFFSRFRQAAGGDGNAWEELKKIMEFLMPKLLMAGIVIGVFLWLYYK